MSAVLQRRTGMRTLADIIAKLGDIPPERILLEPAPGTATEADLIRNNDGDNVLCELVFGTLVEKAVGLGESKLEGWLLQHFFEYLKVHDIGEAIPGTGPYRLAKGIVRLPDIGFFLWEHSTSEEDDEENPISNSCPDLAVEVISRTNTPKEIGQKLKEYFKAGTTLAWIIYPRKKTVEVYSSPSRFRTLTVDDTLDGGELLPEFRLSLRKLFSKPTKFSKRRK